MRRFVVDTDTASDDAVALMAGQSFRVAIKMASIVGGFSP